MPDTTVHDLVRHGSEEELSSGELELVVSPRSRSQRPRFKPADPVSHRKRRASLSRSLRRLEERGLILRMGKAPNVAIALTDDGVQAAERIKDDDDS